MGILHLFILSHRSNYSLLHLGAHHDHLEASDCPLAEQVESASARRRGLGHKHDQMAEASYIDAPVSSEDERQ